MARKQLSHNEMMAMTPAEVSKLPDHVQNVMACKLRVPWNGPKTGNGYSAQEGRGRVIRKPLQDLTPRGMAGAGLKMVQAKPIAAHSIFAVKKDESYIKIV